MELKIKDMVELLQVPEREILQLIQTKKLPAHKIHHQYYFNKQEVKEWIIVHGIPVNEKILELKLAIIPVSIASLIRKGGMIGGVQGNKPAELLRNVVDRMTIPAPISPENVLASLIEREEMMPTSIGLGIAIPHPRNPIITDIENESITVCSLAKPVDYQAMDGKLVHTLFIIMSANAKRHLEILSKLAFLCQQSEFIKLCESGSPLARMLVYIEDQENQLRERLK
jgi:PTS system nitrogen regulatory IIA component